MGVSNFVGAMASLLQEIGQSAGSQGAGSGVEPGASGMASRPDRQQGSSFARQLIEGIDNFYRERKGIVFCLRSPILIVEKECGI